MFKNLQELLGKLKSIRDAISSGDLDKIGDLLEEVSKLIGFGQYGTLVDDMLDAIVVKNYAKMLHTTGSLLQTVSVNLPDGQSTPQGFGFDAVPTAGHSECPKLDSLIQNLEIYCSSLSIASTTSTPTQLPLQAYILICQTVFELFRILRKGGTP